MLQGRCSISPVEQILLDYLNLSSRTHCELVQGAQPVTDYRQEVLYPETLLCSLISSNSFLVKPLRFSVEKIISPENKNDFTSSFLVWVPLFPFLARLL